MTRPISEEQENEIIAMYNSDMSAYQIAEELGYHPGTIYTVLRRRGVPRRAGGARPQNQEQWPALVEDYRSGKFKTYELAEKYNVSMSQLWYILKVMGEQTQLEVAADYRKVRDELACKMYVAGYKIYQIFAETKLDGPRLYVILRRHGIPLRRETIEAKATELAATSTEPEST